MANTAFTHDPTITVPSSSTANAIVTWNGTTGKSFSNSTIIVGATTMGLAADTDLLTFGNGTLAITGTVTGITTITATTFSGALSGNATSATSAATLTTTRAIGGVNFNGSAAITLPGVNSAGDQNTSGTAAGLSTALVVASGGTGLTSYTAGDIFYYASGTTLTKLAKGSANEVLTMNDGATAPGWETAAGGGPSQASQSAIEAETNEDTYAPPDLIKHSPGVAKGWCVTNDAGSLISGDGFPYNVASVTDVGTGVRGIVWDTDFATLNYVCFGTVNADKTPPYNIEFNTFSTGGVNLVIANDGDTNIDAATASVAFGDQ